MFPSLLTLALAAGADPRPPAPANAVMPRLTDGLAPLKPLSTLTPAVRPVVTDAPSAPPLTEEAGIYPDYLSPDMWLLALRAVRPQLTPTPAKPDVIFDWSNTPARPHHLRNLADAGWKASDWPLVERKIAQDIGSKWPKGGLQPRETVVVKGKPVEYRPFEIAPGKINVGTAYPGRLPPASGFGSSLGRGLGWTAPLLIPSSAILPQSPAAPPSVWDKPSLLPRPDAAPKYGLGVDLTMPKLAAPTFASPLTAPKPPANPAPAWHPPMARPGPATPPPSTPLL
jgi:hypothetical protein